MDKILLTRPQKASQVIAKNLATKNITSLIQPLFSIIPSQDLPKIDQDLQAVLITSGSAIFALEKLAIPKKTLIVAVGKITAEKIKKLGYENILAANKSAALLFDLTIQKTTPKQGSILYLSGEKITVDLTVKLQEKGFLAQRIIVYQTSEIVEFSKEVIEEIRKGNVTQVWIYSENSLIIFHKLAKKHNLLECLSESQILCFSAKIADLANKMNFSKTGICP
ncbi:MAG: uroporphyrinogen-III synthase [Rickettsiales bacterium]|jgi:uroporphyrinogen-III synthase